MARRKAKELANYVPNFAEWFEARRRETHLLTNSFHPIEAGTITRVENGVALARFTTAVHIVDRMGISLPDFAKDYLEIDLELPAAKPNTGIGTGSDDLTENDLHRLIEGYRHKPFTGEFYEKTCLLVGTAYERVMEHHFHTDSSGLFDGRTWNESKSPETLVKTGQLVLLQTLRSSSLVPLPPTNPHLATRFEDGMFATPDDAYNLLIQVVQEHNDSEPSQAKKIPMKAKFNDERYRFYDFLEVAIPLGEEKLKMLLTVFWVAYQNYNKYKLELNNIIDNSRGEVDEIRSTIVSLWRWLQYYGDDESMKLFRKQLRDIISIT